MLLRHPSKHVDRMEYQESTGNLSRHVKACEPEETPETELITAYASGAQYSPARLRFLVAMWCARRHRAFQIVEDPEFHEILRMLYAKAQVPSRVTVSRDVQDIHAMAKANVVEMFNVSAITEEHLQALTQTSDVGSSRQNSRRC